MFLYGYVACIYVELKCVQFPKRPGEGNGSPGTGVAWVLGIKARSSGKAESTLNGSSLQPFFALPLFGEQNWGLNL